MACSKHQLGFLHSQLLRNLAFKVSDGNKECEDMSKETTIKTVSEYVQSVCQLNADTNSIQQFWSYELLFRGQSNKDYDLLPGIARGRHSSCQCTIFNDERNLIEMAKFKMPDVFQSEQTPLELLALLQHHGVPTRLLDVTENALVALYFACCSNPNVDGEVIVFKHKNESIANYPIVNAIADSYRFASRGTWTPLTHFYGDMKNQPYCLEQKQMFDICHSEDSAGGKWVEECCQRIFYIYAPIRSLRQQVQQGRYILFPNHIDYEVYKEGAFEWTMDAIPKNHEDIEARFIVPKEIKQQILDNLYILGISEEFLFCDNIDTVCKGIVETFKRRYRP